MKIELEFKLEKTKLEDYVGDPPFEEFKKFIKNYIIDNYNKGNYEKAESGKEILEHLYYLEQKKGKKSGFYF